MQFADENYQASQNKPFMMASGNRVDLLVQAPTTPAIYPVIVQHGGRSVGPQERLSRDARVGAHQGRPISRVTGKPSQFIPPAPKPPAFLD